MENLRVYKDLYCIDYNSVSNNEIYTLINVTDLTLEIKTIYGNNIELKLENQDIDIRLDDNK